MADRRVDELHNFARFAVAPTVGSWLVFLFLVLVIPSHSARDAAAFAAVGWFLGFVWACIVQFLVVGARRSDGS